MSELYRTEALEDRKTLLGDVSLVVPVQSWVLFVVALALFLVLIMFLAFGSIYRTERTSGWVRPNGAVTRIYSRGNWQITNVFVREGAIVKRGDPLLEARDLSLMSGDEESLRAVLDQGEAERLALKGELVSRAHAFTTGTQKAVDLLTIKRSEIAAIEREIRLQDAREDGAERTLDVARRLASRGYVSRLQLRQYEDAALDAGQKTAALQQRKAELEGDAEEFREEPARLRDEFVTARSGIDQKLSQLEQRRTQAQAAWRFVIRAPVDGQIADLQVRAGDVTRQNQFQVAVVPTSSNLEAELFVPSQGVGPLRVGQLVHVHYDAYPYQLYGYGLASIASVSKTSIPSSDAPVHLSTDEPVYRVVLELARPSLLSKGRHTIELRAGMTLRADIVLDREPLWRGLIKLFNPDPE